MRKLKVLIAGRSKDAAESVQKMLREHPQCNTTLRIITNGLVNPLQGLTSRPDLLILQHAPESHELKTLEKLDVSERVPLIVFGPADDTNAVRLAMRAGARDYLPWPVVAEELRNAVSSVAEEYASRKTAEVGSLQVFANAKGGAGSSFLAVNLAHGLANNGHRVTLIDLDLQFSGLYRYLDIEPERGLFEALEALDEMDELSANAFTMEHKSGLRLLSAKSDRLRLNADVSPDRLVELLQTYRRYNDFVIVDLPRTIDLLSAAVLETADRISLVLQQSLPHLHEGSRFMDILRGEIGIEDQRISVILNRFVKDAPITQKDVEKALHVPEVLTIPNQYKLVAESINSGIPLAELAKNANVAKGLRQLHELVGGQAEPEAGFLSRALPGLLRR